MSAPVLFEPPIVTSTERIVLDLLRRRYYGMNGNTPRWILAEHAPVDPLGYGSIADLVAIDCWRSSGFAIHGHEVKVSRSDWLRELRDPDKAEAWKRHCHRWWLVVSDRRIVHDGELPEGWGLLAATATCLRQVVAAPKLTPEPMPPATVAGLLRATAKTAGRLR